MPDASVTGDRESSNGLRILGPGSPPHLGFACCEYGVEQMQSLFAQPDLIETLKDLHATVAIPTQDFLPSGLESCAFSIEKAHRLLPGLFCPESRCSQEFYDNCNRALAEVGLMVVNLCVKNHRRILSRIRKSFGGQIVLSTDDDGNTVVFACKGAVALVEKNSFRMKLKRFERKYGLGRAMAPRG